METRALFVRCAQRSCIATSSARKRTVTSGEANTSIINYISMFLVFFSLNRLPCPCFSRAQEWEKTINTVAALEPRPVD